MSRAARKLKRRASIRTQAVDYSALAQQFRGLVALLPDEFNGPVSEMYRHVLATQTSTHVASVGYVVPTAQEHRTEFDQMVETIKARPKPKPRAQIIY